MKQEDMYRGWAKSARFSAWGAPLKDWVERTYADNLCEALQTTDLDGKSILEIGPGYGHFAALVQSLGGNYSAIEGSRKLASLLEQRRFRVVHSTFPSDDPYSGEQFDVVYLSHVLEHMDTKHDAVALILACREKLTQRGVIVINCPNFMSHGKYFWFNDYTHNFVTTPNRVHFLLEDCGLQPILEKRMVFGLQNPALRRMAAAAFKVVPSFLLDVALRRLRPHHRSSAQIYGSENFTIAARKLADAEAS